MSNRSSSFPFSFHHAENTSVVSSNECPNPLSSTLTPASASSSEQGSLASSYGPALKLARSRRSSPYINWNDFETVLQQALENHKRKESRKTRFSPNIARARNRHSRMSMSTSMSMSLPPLAIPSPTLVPKPEREPEPQPEAKPRLHLTIERPLPGPGPGASRNQSQTQPHRGSTLSTPTGTMPKAPERRIHPDSHSNSNLRQDQDDDTTTALLLSLYRDSLSDDSASPSSSPTPSSPSSSSPSPSPSRSRSPSPPRTEKTEPQTPPAHVSS